MSRMTARQAVQTLANERLLYRTRGQGTFVAPRPVPRVLGSPLSFTESMRSRGMSATSQILASGTVESSAVEAKALGLTTGEDALVLERLRLADGTPMAIERVVFSPVARPCSAPIWSRARSTMPSRPMDGSRRGPKRK